MRVLAFGTYDVSMHPRVGILVEGLRDHGAVVEEAVRPLGLSTAERVRILQQPWRLPILAARLLRSWGAILTTARFAARRDPYDAVLVGYLGHFDVVLARLAFPRTQIVLDHLIFAGDTARDRGATGIKNRLLDLLDRVALRCADVIVLDTEEHAALVPARRRQATVVCPVGADAAWFEAGDSAARADHDKTDWDRLRVVFYGLHTPLQGTVTIAEALARLRDRTDIAVTMVGRGQDYSQARAVADANHRVRWLDWLPAPELRAMVAAHDVCLGIFGTSPKAARVVPNKAYQGAAAGCVVITSDTAPQRRTLGPEAIFVEPGDADALSQALDELAEERAADPAALARRRSATASHARAHFLPRAVVEPLWSVLTRRTARRRA